MSEAEKWLGCLDRAILILASAPSVEIPESFIGLAQKLYENLPPPLPRPPSARA